MSTPGSNHEEDGGTLVDLDKRIRGQGERVRDLISKNAPKEQVDAEVKILLTLKAEYKSGSGSDWKPDIKPVNPVSLPPASGSENVRELNDRITKQSNMVRDLKTKTAPKSEIGEAIGVLLDLKDEYRNKTGSDWKPGTTPPTATSSGSSGNVNTINQKIIALGNKVREMKAAKVPKNEFDDAVELLWLLKEEYKTKTRINWKLGTTPPAASSSGSDIGDLITINEKTIGHFDKFYLVFKFKCELCEEHREFVEKLHCMRHMTIAHSGFIFRCTTCRMTMAQKDKQHGCPGKTLRRVKKATLTMTLEETREFEAFQREREKHARQCRKIMAFSNLIPDQSKKGTSLTEPHNMEARQQAQIQKAARMAALPRPPATPDSRSFKRLFGDTLSDSSEEEET